MTHRCRILVIEDEDAIQELVRLACIEKGFEVLQARNSLEGAEQIRLDGFDVVIIDIALPGNEDGFALAKRAAETSVGVILIGGHPEHFAPMEASGHASLPKPFRLDQLLALIDEVLTKTGRDCWHLAKERLQKAVR
jgi:DNA-binding response OmpR family regulator